MTITLQEKQGYTAGLTVRGVPADVANELIAQLPPDVILTVDPDRPEDRTEECPACGARPAGYFGLAVALARSTWKG